MMMDVWILRLLPALVILIIGYAHARSLNNLDHTGKKDSVLPIYNRSLALNDSGVIVNTVTHWNNQSSNTNLSNIEHNDNINLPKLNDSTQHIPGKAQSDNNGIKLPYLEASNKTRFNNNGSENGAVREIDSHGMVIPHSDRSSNVSTALNKHGGFTENDRTSNGMTEVNEINKAYGTASQDKRLNNASLSPAIVDNENNKLTRVENASVTVAKDENASVTVAKDENASVTVAKDMFDMVKNTTVRNEAPYFVHGDHVHDLQLHHDKAGVHLKHHLQLVPMEDEPFGTLIFKDERYLVSVFIPIAIGILGATIIIVTLYTMRYVAMKQGRQYTQHESNRWRQQVAGSSSIQDDEEQMDPSPHDKIVLLSPDDDDDQF